MFTQDASSGHETMSQRSNKGENVIRISLKMKGKTEMKIKCKIR